MNDIGKNINLFFENRLLNKKELALKLNCSVGHISNLVSKGYIPYLKIGDLVRFDPKKILHWLAPLPVRK